MTAPRKAGRDGGFTLLEVLVAMTILAAGIIGLSMLFTGALRLAAGARDVSASTIYARQRMAEAVRVPAPVDGVEQGNFGDKYRWEVATTVLPKEEGKPYRDVRIKVTVQWQDGGWERAVDLSATRVYWAADNAAT
ncbi:MAG: prepilin-type N-terminal cleavage/methylation domain-containing protein [Candidatus Deferrimicrobium sp.]